MPDIFLSYCREDQAIARHFAEGLRREGFDVWWDQTLHSGDSYDRVTEQALRDAKATVVLWSASSVQSRWVRAEATIADRLGRLVPVMIGRCDRPLMFELTHAADLSHWQGEEADPGWRTFVADVRRFVAGEAAPFSAMPLPAAAVPTATPERASKPRPLRYALYAALLLLAGAGGWLMLPKADDLKAGLAAGAPARKSPVSIAVLPFVDMTAQGGDASLGEGLADEISNWLAQIPSLHVVARTSSFMFKGMNQDVRQVGRALNATHVVEGSIRRGGDTVRVTVQLVAAADGYHQWSRTFDMQDSNALRIEDVVSRAVAEALNARLSDETERRWKARQSQVPQAYALYLQGRSEMKRASGERNLRAMDLFRQAIEQDRDFALAYASLAEATMYSLSVQGRPLAAVEVEVTELLDRAEALSPDLPETIGIRGWLALEQYRTDDALVLLQRVLELNPNDADAHRRLGNIHARLGQPSRARSQYVLAADLDPLDMLTRVRLCLSLQDLAEFAAAEEACRRARELDAESYWGPLVTSYLEFGRGKFAASLRWADRAFELAPGRYDMLDHRVWLLLEMGLYDEAARTVARIPASASPQRAFREALIALAKQDRAALAAALDAASRGSGQFGMHEWLELARLQFVSGDGAAAKASLERARQSPDWQPAYQARPDFVRLGSADAVFVAAIELSAGNRASAMQQLDALDEMLDRMEQDGAACSGLHALRAYSRALRDDPEGAMASLRKAHEKGWRESSTARREPYLQSLRDRPDFQQLLATTDRELRAEAAELPTAFH